jgi:nitrogen fixation protein FixH
MHPASTTSVSTGLIMTGLNTTEPNPGNSAKTERRAKRVWVGVIVTFLALQVVGGIVTIYLATSDPTVAVIPNYYQSGLNWDVKRRNLDQFTNLGWHVVVNVQAADEELQQRQVTIHLKKNEYPVGKQRVSASIFHHGRGNEIFKLNFDEALEGQYVAICRLAQAGLWQFDIAIEGDHGLAETRFTMDVGKSGATEYRFPQSSVPVVKN